MTRRQRRRAAIGAILVAVVAIVAVGGLLSGGSGTSQAREEGEFPSALAGHLDQLRQTVPGNQGMAEDGPASGAEAAFLERAYPAETISLQAAAAARAAFSASKGRPFPAGKGKKGTWVSVGPSQALYPKTPFRNAFSYVPTDYVAGGRTTAIAIADSCKPGDCKLYITPAGGGIWRTKNALTGQPNWEYLGGPLGINSAGAVTIDPNDASGNTIYVGTGEANICASGCVAGVGIYKSTNGGDTWTGPLGGTATDTGNPLAGKGVGKILIKPGSPNTIYAATTTALRGMSEVCCSGVTRPVPGAAKWGLYKSTNGGASWTFIHNGSPSAASCTGDATEFANGSACSPRGVRSIALDPTNPEIVYAGSYARGVWRSPDGGATWTQIKPSLNCGGDPNATEPRRDDAAERRDADVRVRGQHRQPVQPPLPLGRRLVGRAGIHRPDELERREPRLRDVQSLHRAVLVRLVRLHAEGPPRHRLRGRLVLLRRERSRTSAR